MIKTVRYIVIFLIFVCSQITSMGQTAQSLKQKMWQKAEYCNSMLEFDGESLHGEVIDDTKNGYLKISGSYPPCGCSCEATVGAYADNYGNYTLLEQEFEYCSWRRVLSSSRNLSDILPDDFGISTFIPKFSTKISSKFAYFYTEAEIPRKGTDTKLVVKTVPFGLYVKCGNFLTTEIKEMAGVEQETSEDDDYRTFNTMSLYSIRDLVNFLENTQTLEFILNGEFNKISGSEQKAVDKALKNGVKSKDELRKCIVELKQVFDLYSEMEYDAIILGWDRDKARFYIKEKLKKQKTDSFLLFLKNSEFWEGIC